MIFRRHTALQLAREIWFESQSTSIITMMRPASPTRSVEPHTAATTPSAGPELTPPCLVGRTDRAVGAHEPERAVRSPVARHRGAVEISDAHVGLQSSKIGR